MTTLSRLALGVGGKLHFYPGASLQADMGEEAYTLFFEDGQLILAPGEGYKAYDIDPERNADYSTKFSFVFESSEELPRFQVDEVEVISQGDGWYCIPLPSPRFLAWPKITGVGDTWTQEEAYKGLDIRLSDCNGEVQAREVIDAMPGKLRRLLGSSRWVECLKANGF